MKASEIRLDLDDLPLDPGEVREEKLVRTNGSSIPYLGEPIHVRDNDSPNRKAKLNKVANVRIYDLSKPSHILAYEAVSQRAADKSADISYEERQYDAETKSWRVLIRWIDKFYGPPEVNKYEQANVTQ